MDQLTDDDRALLDFEAAHWKYAGAKEARIRQTFDHSATRYYSRLNHLIEQPAALAYNPMLIKRLQRIRDARRAHRHATNRTLDL